jgi:MFS family permease
MKSSTAGAVAAWLLAALYYFYQYTLRSSPGVMLPQLSETFGLSAAGVATLIGIFYYGYAPFSLVAGAALDRFGAKAVLPVGALITGTGALLFGTGNIAAANIGRFLQGAGGVFALVGAIYIVGKHFPESRTATLVGATQVFGSSGGSAGQFLVGPMIASGLGWNHFWLGMGTLGILIGVSLFLLLPKEQSPKRRNDWIKDSLKALTVVFKNPQSILCGLIAGLVFIPTSIFDMIWGVRFLQEGYGFDYSSAVMRSATVPLGWIIGSPLMGWISDRIGRRKPVIVAASCMLFLCLAWILYGRADVFPAYAVGLVTGIVSGAAMLTYTVIKEANPSQYSGTATGVISFINFTFAALLGPVFARILQDVSSGNPRGLEHYQTTFQLLLYGVALAAFLTLGWLKETGPAVHAPVVTAEAA